MAFIDAMRVDGHAVKSVCRVLREQGCQIAARAYRSWLRPVVSARTISDAVVTDALLATRGTPESLYGRRKMTAFLRRSGMPVVAHCTVDRLMREHPMNGVRRGRSVRTTIRAKDGVRAGDLLDRDFTASAPNRVWVANSPTAARLGFQRSSSVGTPALREALPGPGRPVIAALCINRFTRFALTKTP